MRCGAEGVRCGARARNLPRGAAPRRGEPRARRAPSARAVRGTSVPGAARGRDGAARGRGGCAASPWSGDEDGRRPSFPSPPPVSFLPRRARGAPAHRQRPTGVQPALRERERGRERVDAGAPRVRETPFFPAAAPPRARGVGGRRAHDFVREERETGGAARDDTSAAPVAPDFAHTPPPCNTTHTRHTHHRLTASPRRATRARGARPLPRWRTTARPPSSIQTPCCTRRRRRRPGSRCEEGGWRGSGAARGDGAPTPSPTAAAPAR